MKAKQKWKPEKNRNLFGIRVPLAELDMIKQVIDDMVNSGREPNLNQAFVTLIKRGIETLNEN